MSRLTISVQYTTSFKPRENKEHLYSLDPGNSQRGVHSTSTHQRGWQKSVSEMHQKFQAKTKNIYNI